MENQIVASNPENFFCPIGTELVLRLEERDMQLKTALIGMDRGRFLIIRIPRAKGFEPELMSGSPFKVLFLYDGTIYGFKSKVMMSIMSPTPLLFIAYPENLQRHELRKNLRMDCSIPVKICEKEGAEYCGLITNLSLGGCKLTILNDPAAAAQLKIDDAFELSSEMLGIGHDRALRSIIKNIHLDKKKIHLGLQFESADASVLERIQIFMNRVLDIIQ